MGRPARATHANDANPRAVRRSFPSTVSWWDAGAFFICRTTGKVPRAERDPDLRPCARTQHTIVPDNPIFLSLRAIGAGGGIGGQRQDPPPKTVRRAGFCNVFYDRTFTMVSLRFGGNPATVQRAESAFQQQSTNSEPNVFSPAGAKILWPPANAGLHPGNQSHHICARAPTRSDGVNTGAAGPRRICESRPDVSEQSRRASTSLLYEQPESILPEKPAQPPLQGALPNQVKHFSRSSAADFEQNQVDCERQRCGWRKKELSLFRLFTTYITRTSDKETSCVNKFPRIPEKLKALYYGPLPVFDIRNGFFLGGTMDCRGWVYSV